MDRDPLPIDESGNGSRLRTLTYDEADAFMLAHAMMIASNTAMMSQGPIALKRLNHYRDQFMSFAPPAAKLLRRDTDLCEIAVTMADSPSWSAHRRLQWSYSDKGETVITVTGKEWTSSNETGPAEHEAIIAMLERIAPLSCRRQDREDEVGKRGW